MIELVSIKNCPICQSPDPALVSDRVKTINAQSDLRINLMECPQCKHWWNTPIPSQDALIALYQDASAFVVSDNWGEDIQKEKPILFFDRLILSFAYPASFCHYLEVGCGAGHMLKMMREKVETCFGIEPGHWGKDANIVDRLDQVPPQLDFNIFVFQDVVEHMADPVSTLSMYSARAASDAVLFVSFPNKDAMIAQRNKERWGMVRPFGHLHYFSLQSLTRLLEKGGWQVSQIFRGPSRFPLTHWKTYNLPRTAKKMYQNDQWYVVGKKNAVSGV